VIGRAFEQATTRDVAREPTRAGTRVIVNLGSNENDISRMPPFAGDQSVTFRSMSL
jgi:hypothetical protein